MSTSLNVSNTWYCCCSCCSTRCVLLIYEGRAMFDPKKSDPRQSGRRRISSPSLRHDVAGSSSDGAGANLQQMLAVFVPRVRSGKPGRLPAAQRSGATAFLHPRQRRQAAGLSEHMHAPRRADLPARQGACRRFAVLLPCLELQQSRRPRRRAGRGRLPGQLRPNCDGSQVAAARGKLPRLCFCQLQSGCRRARDLSRGRAGVSGPGRRSGRKWHADRRRAPTATRSRPTGSCWSRTASTATTSGRLTRPTSTM